MESDEGKCCFYCLRKNIQVYKLDDWTGRQDQVRYYCREHYLEVKKFQEQQKKNFIDYFSRISVITNEDVENLLKKFKS